MAGWYGFNGDGWSGDSFLHSIFGPFSFFFNQSYDQQQTKKHQQAMRDWIKSNYPELSDSQIEQLIAQYGDTSDAQWWQIFSAGSDTSKWEDLENELKKIQGAYDTIGEMPKDLTADDYAKIQQDAYDEIDAENRQLLDLYNSTFQNNSSALKEELLENSAMFGDYRNQILTNEAMRQQAIAGSTRFELDRQQRNAITRGASAAQRLVSSINAQLGLQAQSAQQSLDTSNALAQNLLAHRQAQQGVRNSYLNAQNQYNQNVASTISGQAERRFNYGEGRKEGAYNDYQRSWDAWNNRVDDYFHGDSFGADLYRNSYGRNNPNKL